jgi:hypothetical protein
VLKHLLEGEQNRLVNGEIPLTFDAVARSVSDPNGSPAPDLGTSNATFHKGNPRSIFEYLFGPGDTYQGLSGKPKKRDHWKDKSFRVIFHQILNLISQHISPGELEQWQNDLFLIIHATNPLLPVPDGTVLISRKQNKKGYSWLAFKWDQDLPAKSITCRELLRYLHGKPPAWCKGDGSNYSWGSPARLKFEDDFLGKTSNHVQKKMAELLESRS